MTKEGQQCSNRHQEAMTPASTHLVRTWQSAVVTIAHMLHSCMLAANSNYVLMPLQCRCIVAVTACCTAALPMSRLLLHAVCSSPLLSVDYCFVSLIF